MQKKNNCISAFCELDTTKGNFSKACTAQMTIFKLPMLRQISFKRYAICDMIAYHIHLKPNSNSYYIKEHQSGIELDNVTPPKGEG